MLSFGTFCPSGPGPCPINSELWPEAEDKALRGRNLSAVFRTLDQAGEGSLAKGCSPSPAWVENQSVKSTIPTARGVPRPVATGIAFLKHKILTSPPANECPFFRGKYTKFAKYQRASVQRCCFLRLDNAVVGSTLY